MIAESESAEPRAAWLADLVEARRHDILRAYQEALEALGNPIVRDAVTVDQVMENATQILADVVESLRTGQIRVGDAHKFLSQNIGMTRAADGVHPSDSLQAASVLFGIVLSATADCLGANTEEFSLFATVAMALERSIGMRIRSAVVAYTSFLLNQVHEAQISERRRIARDLHDRLGHSINITHRQLELFGVYQKHDPVKAFEKVECAHRAVLDTMRNLRAVTSDLYTVQPFKSLDTALLNYIDCADTDGVDVRLRVNGDESWAPAAVLDEIFLVVREAVHNALNHAAPTTVVINVDITPHEIRGFVEDDGLGFDPEVPPRSGGLGVASMRERVRLLNGALKIRSRAGQGTHIDFAVPLPGEDDDNSV